jgi:glycyl-tRNA synthetase
MSEAIQSTEGKMEKLVALCRRRGFIFQSSEIYGGINGFWDYGPLGVELKRNLKDAWWRDIVRCPPRGPDGKSLEMVGLDSTIIMNRRVWEASGHATGFNDPMSMCKYCKKLFRADQVWDLLKGAPWVLALADKCLTPAGEGYTLQSQEAARWAATKGKKLAPGLALVRNPTATLSWLAENGANDPHLVMPLAKLLQHIATEQKSATGLQTPCPECGGTLTEPRQFNLMFQTHTGAVRDDDSMTYLRPETAQGIFANFRNITDTTRVKIPFGIAQIGKAFRNEVTPRNFTFRSREFEQMEVEFFIHPATAAEWYRFWSQARFEWWQSIGLTGGNLQLRPHDQDELAHYAREGSGTSDIEYRFPFTAPGFGELEGVAHRTDFDLRQHAEFSGLGEKLKYFDQERNERYFPHVIEPSAGADRGTLALLCEAYHDDPSRPSGVVMKFHPRMAPIKAGIFPLVDKDGMPEIAEKLYHELRRTWNVQLDVKQNIGKRYARMDEAGTPFCFTVDTQTLSDQTLTVRYRDTLQQERLHLDDVRLFLEKKVGN